jgi:hypothetical protein
LLKESKPQVVDFVYIGLTVYGLEPSFQQ